MAEPEPIYEYDADAARRRFWPSVGRQLSAILKGRDKVRMLAAVRYRSTHAHTVLGTLWWYLDPLIQMALYSFVAVVAFRVPSVTAGETPVPYPVFVLCGLIPWKSFAATITSGSRAILDGGFLLGKVRISAIVLVAAHVFQQARHHLIGLVLFAAFAAWRGFVPGAAILALPAVAAVQVLLQAGLAVLAANLCTRFRDLLNVLPAALNFLMYLAPVVYGAEQLPERIRPLVEWNPLGVLLGAYRRILLEDRLPDFAPLAAVAAGSVLLFAAAVRRFDVHEGEFPKCP